MNYYADIVFMQGNDADEFLNILHEHGETEVIDRLKDWDNGEYNDVEDTSRAGSNDTKAVYGDYLLTYNTALSYIGLEKIIHP